MKKKIALMVAFGCLGASAASVNYDLLGRKGSKMNSPMVYRNMDYSKTNNDHQNLGSSSISRVLKKDAVGLHNNVYALEGRYNNRGWPDANNYKLYYQIRPYFFPYGSTSANNNPMDWRDLVTRGGYGHYAQEYFFNIDYQDYTNHMPPNPSAQTFTGSEGYSINWQNISLYNNIPHTSPYGSKLQYSYKSISHIRDDEDFLDKSTFNDEYGSLNVGVYNNEWTDVGVYIKSYARPGYMKRGDDVRYYVDPTSGTFKDMPGHEFVTSKLYKIVQNVSSRSVIYSTSKNPQNPSETMNGRPTPIYMGIRSNLNTMGHETSNIKYTAYARDLDNYIYDNRTIELVSAGNSGANYAVEAHAANAITVGAIDPVTKQVVEYMPNVRPKYCPAASKPCSGNNGLVNGARKPEIYSYTHFYTNDQRTDYTNNGKTTSFEPFHEGTESAAALTAGMVSDLLVTNSFYRWHPEVVKALLITSSQVNDGKVPTYRTTIPMRGALQGVAHESRYWVGDIKRLTTLINTGKKDIWFSVPRPSNTSHYVAAISWLSRGDDIERLGKIPQDFDIRAYETDFDVQKKYPYETYGMGKPAVTISGLGKSLGGAATYNSFEKFSFTATSDYITFCITLFSDESSSDYQDQVVLGFDMASY